MLAVGLPESEVALRLSEGGGLDVVVAAVNGPDSVTLAGPLAAIETYTVLGSEDVFAAACR